MSDIQIEVVKDDVSKNFVITYSMVNKYTNRKNTKTFKYYYGTKSKVPTVNQLKGLMIDIIMPMDDKKLFGVNKNDPHAVTTAEIRSLLSRRLKNMSRSHKGQLLLLDLENSSPKDLINKNTSLDQKINKWGPKSIFQPEESAKTTCILGASFTGKTTLLVNELNKLNKESYDKIVLFTESTSADPLKALHSDLDIKIIDRFCPSIPKFLKDINSETNNKFKFLLILDDVIELKNSTFSKMILTMRNSNISTVVLLQHVKLITPSSRNSIHNYYITGLRIEDWEYVLRAFLASHFRHILDERGSYTKLSERVKDYMKGKTLYYDQRKDEIHFFLK